MPEWNWQIPEFSLEQIVAGLAGLSLMLILSAVWLAYRLGRDRGLGVRVDRMDRLYVEINLHGTVWKLGDTLTGESCTAAISQLGSRIRVEGRDAKRQNWVAEGVVFRRELHLLFVERRARGQVIGSLNLSLDGTDQVLSGMQCCWEGDQTGGMIETVTWSRVTANSDSVDDETNVVNRQHEPTTVAKPQHLTNVFRPVDTSASELVAVDVVAINTEIRP